MKKTSIRKAWLTVCTASVVLVGMIFLIYNIYVKNSVLKLERDINTKSAEHIKTMLDDTWENLQEFTRNQYFDTHAKNLEASQSLEDYRKTGAYQLMLDIKNVAIQNLLVADIMYYYPKTDYIVGRYGVYPSKTYWLASYFAQPKMEYEQWKTTLFTPTESETFLVNSLQEQIIYMRAYNKHIGDRVVIIKINMDEVAKRLGWITQNSTSKLIAVVDNDDTVYCYQGDYDSFVQPETRQLNVSDSEYLVTQTYSDVDGLKYVSVSEKSQVFSISSNMIPVATMLLIITCMVSISIAFFLIQLYTKPMQLIANMFQDNEEQQRTELETINLGINGLLKKQSDLMKLASQQQFTINQSFMNELLFFGNQSPKNILDVANFYGLSMSFDCFCIVAIRRNEDVTNSTIINMLERQEENLNLYWIEKNGIDIFLVNYDKDDLAAPERFISQIHIISEKKLEIARSRAVDSQLYVTSCWVECAHALGCTSLLKDELSKNGQKKLSFTDHVVDEMREYLENGNYSGLQQLAPIVFEACENKEDPFIFACNKYRIVRLLMPYCPQSERNSLEELTQLNSKDRWIRAFRDVLDACDSNHCGETGKKNNEIALQIRRIIDQQFSNPSLDLRMISEMVGFSQPYISKAFKEKYAAGISQYINQVRIEYAKELILKGNDNIKAIALKVGFAGDTQFIRAFKRIENITPGGLRGSKTNIKQNDN